VEGSKKLDKMFYYSTGVSSDSLSDPCFLLINLSTDPIANEPSTKIKNELKINSLITNGKPIKPVTMSAQANKHITNISEITWIYHVGHPSTLGMPIRW
jgi:hypothetical protein